MLIGFMFNFLSVITYRLKNWNDWTYLTDGEK